MASRRLRYLDVEPRQYRDAVNARRKDCGLPPSKLRWVCHVCHHGADVHYLFTLRNVRGRAFRLCEHCAPAVADTTTKGLRAALRRLGIE